MPYNASPPSYGPAGLFTNFIDNSCFQPFVSDRDSSRRVVVKILVFTNSFSVYLFPVAFLRVRLLSRRLYFLSTIIRLNSVTLFELYNTHKKTTFYLRGFILRYMSKQSIVSFESLMNFIILLVLNIALELFCNWSGAM